MTGFWGGCSPDASGRPGEGQGLPAREDQEEAGRLPGRLAGQRGALPEVRVRRRRRRVAAGIGGRSVQQVNPAAKVLCAPRYTRSQPGSALFKRERDLPHPWGLEEEQGWNQGSPGAPFPSCRQGLLSQNIFMNASVTAASTRSALGRSARVPACCGRCGQANHPRGACTACLLWATWEGAARVVFGGKAASPLPGAASHQAPAAHSPAARRAGPGRPRAAGARPPAGQHAPAGTRPRSLTTRVPQILPLTPLPALRQTLPGTGPGSHSAGTGSGQHMPRPPAWAAAALCALLCLAHPTQASRVRIGLHAKNGRSLRRSSPLTGLIGEPALRWHACARPMPGPAGATTGQGASAGLTGTPLPQGRSSCSATAP